MSILIHTKSLIPKFFNGEVVFKITSRGDTEEPVGMVITNKDYERRLGTHQYLPILYIISFYKQAAYLYGCLNLKYQKPRRKIYTFWWRNLGDIKWEPWFSVHPYTEPGYNFQEESDD